MDFFTATTTATGTLYSLTDNGFNLVNELFRLVVFCTAILLFVLVAHFVIDSLHP